MAAAATGVADADSGEGGAGSADIVADADSEGTGVMVADMVEAAEGIADTAVTLARGVGIVGGIAADTVSTRIRIIGGRRAMPIVIAVCAGAAGAPPTGASVTPITTAACAITAAADARSAGRAMQSDRLSSTRHPRCVSHIGCRPKAAQSNPPSIR